MLSPLSQPNKIIISGNFCATDKIGDQTWLAYRIFVRPHLLTDIALTVTGGGRYKNYITAYIIRALLEPTNTEDLLPPSDVSLPVMAIWTDEEGE